MLNRKLLFIVLLLSLPLPLAHAGEAMPTAEDPVLEKRVMTLAHKLRCLVCQNQTIADSNAELAIDLRNQVRDQLKQGKSEKEVLNYMSSRYGDFVLFQPMVKPVTWLLWFAPLLLVLLGLCVLTVMLFQRRKLMGKMQNISDEEHARAASLLSEQNIGDRS